MTFVFQCMLNAVKKVKTSGVAGRERKKKSLFYHGIQTFDRHLKNSILSIYNTQKTAKTVPLGVQTLVTGEVPLKGHL